MKAIQVPQFGDPEVMKLVDLPDPTAAANQLVIAVKAIGVNPVETYIRAGRYGPRDFPYVPGSDAAGVVESVGPQVKHFKPGDRVYTANTAKGAYAQKILASENQVFPLPPKITFAQGACPRRPRRHRLARAL